jgi:hypothetical protein
VQKGSIVFPLKEAPPDTTPLEDWINLYRREAVTAYVKENFNRPAQDFLKTPYPDKTPPPANFQIFGRSIENLWLLQLEDNKTGNGKQLKDLAEVRLVFSYRTPRRDAVDTGVAPAATPDLSFLTQPGGKPPKAPSVREFFGPAWNDSPAVRRERLVHLGKALKGEEKITPPKLVPPEELKGVVRDELKTVFGSPQPSALAILQPLDVRGQVRKARNLLTILAQALEEEYTRPLRSGAKTLEEVGTRTKALETFAETLGKQNERFDALATYVQGLKKLLGVLDGRELPPEAGKRLKEYLATRWEDLVTRELSDLLRKEPGAARAAMIREVLARIYEASEKLKKTDPSKKTGGR